MAGIYLTLLPVLFALTAVMSKSIATGKKFTHIGSFEQRSEENILNIDEFDYFISVVPATWSIAEGDCKFFFGSNATLVAIESVEEWDFLKIKLESYGSQYWTGGMYNPETSLWGWSAHSHPLPPWAPWDVGHPARNPNPLHRVIIAHWSRNSAFWRTVAYTEIYPYICEVQRTTVAVDCYKTNDMIVVLDSSGSIESHNYAKALTFIERLATAFTVHDLSRIALIIFANEAEVIIDITNSYTRAQISSLILNTPYRRGGTRTWLGIDLAIALFNSSRRDVPLNMVVLTDGISGNEALTLAAAQRATAMGIRSFSVGITENINHEELSVIAGGVPNRIFTTDTFDELIQLLTPVSLKVCTKN